MFDVFIRLQNSVQGVKKWAVVTRSSKSSNVQTYKFRITGTAVKNVTLRVNLAITRTVYLISGFRDGMVRVKNR